MTRRVRVGELEIAYDEAGQGDRPLLLVHGFTGFRGDFETQLPALAELGWTLAPDLRGHGSSGHAADPASYHLEQLTRDVQGFLDALGVDRCDLLGHSMGGMVALRLALAAPERVASLVLMDTAATPLGWLPREKFALACRVAREAGMVRLQELLRARAAEDPLRSEADRRLERSWGERYWERHRRRFHAMDPEAYARLGQELMEQESLQPKLGAIDCATLVMVGEQDLHFVDAARLLAEGIRGARHAVIPDAGHQPQLENPQAWLAEMRRHLRTARASA